MMFKPITNEDLSNQNTFRVYFNYVVSLGNELNSRMYLNNVINSSEFIKISSQKKQVDHEKVSKLLRNAWATEIQLCFAKNQPDLIPYANHWACVQTYYSVYLSARSLLVAMNHSSLEKNTHRATIDNMNQEIHKRPNLFPYPWNILCIGDPNKKSLIGFENLPETAKLNHTCSPLSNDVKFLDRYCQFLKTTRVKNYKNKKDTWLQGKLGKRLPKSQAEKLIKNMAPTSLIDCLFRLRVRSNYEDSDIFMPDVTSNQNALDFNNALQSMVFETLLIFELLISAYIKRNKYEEIAKEFLRKHGQDCSLKARLDFILSASF